MDQDGNLLEVVWDDNLGMYDIIGYRESELQNIARSTDVQFAYVPTEDVIEAANKCKRFAMGRHYLVCVSESAVSYAYSSRFLPVLDMVLGAVRLATSKVQNSDLSRHSI